MWVLNHCAPHVYWDMLALASGGWLWLSGSLTALSCMLSRRLKCCLELVQVWENVQAQQRLKEGHMLMKPHLSATDYLFTLCHPCITLIHCCRHPEKFEVHVWEALPVPGGQCGSTCWNGCTPLSDCKILHA